MKLKRLTVIDADSICYICSKDTLEESLMLANDLVLNILNYTIADAYYLVLSDSPYFRHKIEPTYKTRTATGLLFVKEIKQHLREKFNAFSVADVEADDILATLATAGVMGYHVTLASIDKDILKGVPGKNFNYKDFTYCITTEFESYYHEAYQLIVGDSADSIKGIPSYGPAKAKELLKNAVTPEDLLSEVLKAYIAYYVVKMKNSYTIAIDNFTKNYKLVHLLRHIDEYNLYGIGTFKIPKPFLV